MKRFLMTVLIWTLGLAVFTFFFAAYFFDGQHVYRAVVLAAVVFAVITHGFELQSERIGELEKRVETLEKATKAQETEEE